MAGCIATTAVERRHDKTPCYENISETQRFEATFTMFRKVYNLNASIVRSFSATIRQVQNTRVGREGTLAILHFEIAPVNQSPISHDVPDV